ncbi:MAG: helix-turn-helix domain-containing protein [Eubacteriales bacterium]
MQGTVKICFFNEMNHNPGKEVYDHRHGCYELVYYHTGNGTVRMGGGIIPYRSGSFCLIPPMCSHAEYHSAPCRLSFIGFITGDDLRSVCGMHTDTEDMFFARQMKDFFNEQRRKAYGYEMLMQDAVRKILIYLLRAKETETKNVPDRMLYAVNYLNEYYNDRIDMKQLASMCGYGYDYFHHLFRERTGMSPTEYLKRRRLASAAKLLQEGVSCTDAAYRCGFSGSAHFSRVFRKQYGFPPSEIHLHRFDAAADEYFGESSHHEAK